MPQIKRKASPDPQQTGCVDKFSCLPFVIIHDILSMIPLKDAAKTRVLSKGWRRIWASRPVLDFNESLFWGNRESFLTFLENSLDYHDKYGYSGSEIRSLFLKMKVEKNSRSELLVNKFIDFSLRNTVLLSRLHIEMHEHSLHFDLHDKKFFAAALDNLDIHNCRISNCSFRLLNLKSLSLSNVSIEDGDLGNLIAGCPRIEELRIESYPKYFDLLVSNPALKSFLLGSPRGGCKIKIESTNLESFQLCSVYGDKRKVEINSMKTVKSLKLNEVHYPNRIMMPFLNKFPQLEELMLTGCSGFRTLRVSQVNLTRFVVRKCERIRNITIDAPKLKSLEYVGGLMYFAGIESSKELEIVKFNLQPQALDHRWYIWLQYSLESFAHSKLVSLCCANEKDVIFPCELTLLPTINDPKNLEVQLSSCNATTSQQILDSFNRILPGLKTLTLTTSSFISGTTSELIQLL